ncbi:DUF2520 domain-containing protein [Marinihelvus fidelis]|uniref:DUF2520 domain-containing protein n=1 Tax=Marinihelvus fidelis TaxID=2613842 RepID=A0A5N0TBK0_9GAMM|nr:Rossmann-like and DUF2520 domain-containing protein [Marinihelvus fidelis]KAA9132048.1 DUF2520 domain-containing protein [Marinihelvus fidelis]
MKDHDIHYAVLGDGRLARHLRRYFDLLGIRHTGWARRRASLANTARHADAGARLRQALEPATHVLLPVSDDAIAGLLRQYPFLHQHTLVHCSGALSLPGVAGAHPLMTFNDGEYTLDQYRRIPFLVEEGQAFDTLLPGLPNPHHVLPVEQKALYHALCVVAGNFPQLLWSAAAERMKGDLGLSADLLGPYLQQSLDNWLAAPDAALTGPLDRGDEGTLQRHRAVLAGDPLADIYGAFERLHAARTITPVVTGKERAS